MGRIEHNQYIFDGPRANDSITYFDIVLSHGYNGDMDCLAWDSAHKFGVRVIGANLASFKYGLVYGEKALDAAIFIDEEYIKAYSSCEEVGRRKKMKLLMIEIYSSAKMKYQVELRLL